MCDTRTYLPCCRYRGEPCLQHYPPGIYASAPQADVNTEGSAEARSRVTDLLSLAMKWITRRKTPISKMPVVTGSILSLPVELLQQIASHLPLASTAVFAFSNKYICHAIGQDSWVELTKERHKEDQIAFLCLIRDCWFCENCDEFHPRTFDRSPYYRKYDGFDYPFGYQLPSRPVQLAIERKQKGPPHGICPDRLSCAGIITNPEMRIHYAYRVLATGAELILRMDVRIMPPHYQPPPPCIHSLLPLIIVKKVHSPLGPTRHYKADYPYVPRCPEGVSYPNTELLKEFFGTPATVRRRTWSCRFCNCTMHEATTSTLDSICHSPETIARSFQCVGSGTKGDECVDDKWRRTITPAPRRLQMQR
jgi:hypothetical protein